jgi:hypothetical protein
MLFSEQEKNSLLQDFPRTKKLSYKIPYKKVSNYDLVFAIPEGINAYIWFTNYNSKDVCIVIELINNQIGQIYIKPACFHFHLCYGTLLYGTLFKCKGHTHFSLEDILFYKGKDASSWKLMEKINIYHHLFQHDINSIAYNKSFLIIGLPVICSTEEECRSKCKSLPYKVRYLEYRFLNNISSNTIYYEEYDIKPQKTYSNLNTNINTYTNTNSKTFIQSKNHKKQDVVFQVRPDLQNDIYHLYINNGTKFHSIAYIPDYTTSVKMNKLFRKIKENDNLDTLEESDDEEEFQNDKIDKFVYLDKFYNMVCYYSYKFKKWVPDRIAPSHMRIIEEEQLHYIEKNKY